MVSLSSEGKANLARIIAKAVEEGKIPNAVLAVGSADEQLFTTQAGKQFFKDADSAPVTADKSLFWLCSHTKFIVALAALQLIEQGKLSYDTPVVEVIPELANPVVVESTLRADSAATLAKGVITVQHLLSHSGGLFYEELPRVPYWALSDSYISRHDQENPIPYFLELMKGGRTAQPLKFEPGTNFAYGYSADIMGFMIERITGISLEEYLKKNILGPLGIKSTTFYLTPDVKDKLVPLTVRRSEDSVLVPWAGQTELIEQAYECVKLHLGGIGLYSTLPDNLTILRHVLKLHEGGHVENAILKTETVRKIFRPNLNEAGVKSLAAWFGVEDVQWGDGLCLSTTDRPGKRRIWSGNWYGWAGTHYFLDPTTGVAMVFGSQILPPRDPELARLWEELEIAFYAGLEK